MKMGSYLLRPTAPELLPLRAQDFSNTKLQSINFYLSILKLRNLMVSIWEPSHSIKVPSRSLSKLKRYCLVTFCITLIHIWLQIMRIIFNHSIDNLKCLITSIGFRKRDHYLHIKNTTRISPQVLVFFVNF